MIRGIVKSITEGFIKLFSASGRTDESFDDREYFQHYGFTSRPLEGAEIIIIREGNHIIAVASDDRRYRLAVEDGEVALYTDEGDYIALKRNKNIKVVSGNEVDITAPVAKVTASTSCTIDSPSIILGNGATRTIVDERAIPVYNGHTHPNGGVPSTLMVIGNHSTTNTKAL